jgi:L-amino acid N-acyltransferase YncA
MLIRDAEPARDGGACAAIYAPYVLETAISFEEEPPTEPEFALRIETDSARFPWLVAEDGGAVIGYAYASTHRERAAYRWAAEVAVYIDRSHQRRGAGRALYESLLERLQRQGFYMACAGITLPNDASVALHEACGFEPVGVFRRLGWKLGSWHDVGWWQRELRSPEPGRPSEPELPA